MTAERRGCVIAVDPGTLKAGYALLDAEGNVLAQGIEPLAGLAERIAALLPGQAVEAIAMGRGTNANAIARSLEGCGLPVILVDEYETTRFARALYFAENPPRGWRRLLPLGLLTPPRPIDDFAAILIGRRYLAGEGAPGTP